MAEWSTAYLNALPDSAFACVDSKGRHYPHHNAQGNLDLPHLRAALSRIGDASNTQCGKDHLMSHAKAQGMGTMKAEQIGPAHWRVLAIPFGGPLAGRDLDGEFFSPRTDIKADWFAERPVLWHHGGDAAVGADPIGKQGELTKSDDGWWGDIWIERQNRYFAQIEKLMSQGRMFGSSASMPHLVKKASNGEFLVWPHIEQTLSPVPRNPFSVVRAAKASDHFTSAGIELDPALKGLLSDLDTLTADLESDLPSGGGDPAMTRLSSTLDQLDALIRVT